jgi:phosphatidylglycerophosphate synthase
MERVVSVWNPANAVTASRFITLPFFYWAVMNDERQLATIFMLICGLLDKLDGLVAKLFNCRSAFGEVFDAITDGICYGFALVLVAAHGWAPWFPVACILGIGTANTLMRFAYAKRAGRVANYKSYANERLVGYTAYLIGFATGGMEVSFFYWAYVPLMFVTIAYDAKRMLVDPVPQVAAA